MIKLTTNHGVITLELNAEKAPETAANFTQYVKDGHYDNTIFHRVIDGFMIQGGGFDKAMNQKSTKAPIENEGRNGLRNNRGTLAMARKPDPNSATAQFFINHNDNDFLNAPGQDGWGYAVFGKVTQGMDVVDKMAQVPTANAGMHQNVPQTPIVIESVKIISEK